MSTISDVLRQGGRKDSCGPILVRFDHAEVNPSAFQTDFEVKKFECQFPKSDSSQGRSAGQNPQINMEISAGKLTYSTSAKSVKSRHGGSPYQRTLLAIRNKRSGLVKLVETCNVLLGAVVEPPPTTNAVLIKEELKKEEDAETLGDKSDEAKRLQRVTMNKHLVGLFGQTKGKRAYEQADRMAVESSKLAQKLSQAAMNVSEQAVALPTDLASAADADHLIPKCNREASLVEDVYKLDDLIRPEYMSVLVEASQEVVEKYGESKETVDQAVNAKTFSRMFAKNLERFRRSPKMLGAAIYIEAILQFLNLRSAQFSKGASMMQSFIPHIVKEKMFQEFTSVQGTMSPEVKDKAMCHIIVLSLIVNKFQVDFSELSSSFHQTKAEMIKRLARLCGATISTDSLTKTSFIVLKLPLASFDVNAFTKKRGGSKR